MASPPEWDINQYQSWPALDGAVSDITHNGGDQSDLSHNASAEGWYELESKLKDAVGKLGDANEAFQKEYSALSGQFTGASADAFRDFAGKLYKQSEEVYTTVSGRDFATTTGNVGHDIQSFSQKWWELVKAAHDAEEQLKSKAVTPETNAVVQDAYNKLEIELYGKLRELLGDLKARYESRGQDMDALHIAAPSHGNGAGGGAGAGAGGVTPDDVLAANPAMGLMGEGMANAAAARMAADPSAAQPGGAADTSNMTPQELQAARQQAATTAGNGIDAMKDVSGGSGAGTPSGAGTGTGTGTGTDTGIGTGQSGADPAGTADGSSGDLSSPGTDGAGAGSPDSAGSGSADPGAGDTGSGGGGAPMTGSTPGSTGQSSPSGGGASGGGTDPQAAAAQQQQQQEAQKRQKALEDAKNAADEGIAGLQGMGSGLPDTGSGSGGSGSGSPSGSGGGADSPSSSLPSTSSSGPDGGGSDQGAGGADPGAQQRQQALDDARQAANGAMSDLKDAGSSLGSDQAAGGGDSGLVTQAHNDAKQAIGDSIEKMPGYGGHDAYGQALVDAKQAAQQAIDGLSSSSPTLGGVGGGSELATSSAFGGGTPDLGGAGHIGGGLPSTETAGGGAGGTAGQHAMLDTDVASGQGLVAATATAGSPAVASAAPVVGGVPANGGEMPPMMPPMGGGMGGGMGPNQNERQPSTWLQAESGTWGDDAGGNDPPAVLGRD